MTKLFLRFRHSFLGGLETDLGMCAVAKRFLRRRGGAAESHSFFDREFVSIRVDQFHFAGHDVRAVLNCFDFYVSHGRNTKAPNPKPQAPEKLPKLEVPKRQ